MHTEKYYTGKAVAAAIGGGSVLLFSSTSLGSFQLSYPVTLCTFWAASIWLEHMRDDSQREGARQA